MASQFSQGDEILAVYFIIPAKFTNENDCSEDMWEAFGVSTLILC